MIRIRIDSIKKGLRTSIRQVEHFIYTLEDVYGKVYEKLPQIEQDIEFTLKEMALLLDYFVSGKDTTESDSDEVVKVSVLLEELLQEFSMSTKEMADDREIEGVIKRFASSGANHSSGIDELTSMVSIIENRISDIEVISINARIYASQLGERGAAFGVISDNIMALSTEINRQYQGIAQLVGSLQEWNTRFSGNLDSIVNYNGRVTKDQLADFQNVFHSVVESLGVVSRVLNDLTENVSSAIHPINDLMVAIQIQDILRQNLENLIKCFSTMQEQVDALDQKDEKKQGETLSFLDAIGDLCVKLVENVGVHLGDSLKDLQGILGTINHNVENLQDDGALITSFFVGDEDTGEQSGGIGSIFAQIRESLDGFREQLLGLRNEIQNVGDIDDTSDRIMRDISRQIAVIKNRIATLQKLKLITNIELGRLDLKDSSFNQEISSSSSQVIKDVNENEVLINSLQKELQGELVNFQRVLQNNLAKVERMLGVIATSHESISFVEQMVAQAIQGLGMAADSLISEVKSVADELEGAWKLTKEADEVRASLETIVKEIKTERKALSSRMGVENAQISTDLMSVLSNLTTRVERLAVNQVFAEANVDAGNDDGELTLF